MELKDILLEKEGHVAVLTLNRPDKLNSFGEDLKRSFPLAIEAIEADDEIRAVVLTGAGRAFCAGGDVGDQQKVIDGGPVQPSRCDNLILTGEFILGLEKTSKPIIAAINGVAVGVGLTLALACDIRIAADSARFAAIWVKRGLIPDGGATYLLPRIVGMDVAMTLCYTGEMLSAAQAREIKLVTEVVPVDELMDRAKALAEQIASMPPVTVGLTKNLMWEEIRSQMRKTLIAETYGQNLCRKTADHKEAVAAFLEKREPQYRGH